MGTGGSAEAGVDAGPPGSAIQNVFVVLEENHDWSSVSGLPYIKHLQQIGAHSEQYFNPPNLHPSEPNYIWLEAGRQLRRGRVRR